VVLVLASATVARAEDPAALSQLFQDALNHASRLRSDAFLVDYAAKHSTVNLERQAEEMGRHLSQARQCLLRLGEYRSPVNPHPDVDRLEPVLQELVSNTEILSRYLRQDASLRKQDRDLIAARAALSASLATLVEGLVNRAGAVRRIRSLAGRPAAEQTENQPKR
jgi:hypothetical protein